MGHLSDVSGDDLRRLLDDVEDKKPALRLVAAIAYLNGVSQSELADWLGVERKTIYNWLTRLDRQELEDAVRDEDRPGRPRKLTDDQLEALEALLSGPPGSIGDGTPGWTTALVQTVIRERFGVDYSRASCRRLMREAGLQYEPGTRLDTAAADAEWSEFSPVWTPG